MPKSQSVYCSSCGQTFIQNGTEKCSLCGKKGTVLYFDDPVALRDLQTRTRQRAESGAAEFDHWLQKQARRCGQCGSMMAVDRITRRHLYGCVPWGDTLHFRCCQCGKEVDIHDALTYLTMSPSIILLVPAVWALSNPDFGWQVALTCAGFPLAFAIWLLFGMITRKRYPLLANRDERADANGGAAPSAKNSFDGIQVKNEPSTEAQAFYPPTHTASED